MLFRALIRLNNRLSRWRRIQVPGANLLLLAPHCLQQEDCPQNIVHDLENCRRCGKCAVADLLKLRDEFGLAACVVGGGRQAARRIRQGDVRAVVAIACEKELVYGIFSAFPKPVLAVVNATPEGPCRNTTVDMAQVRAAVTSLITGQPA